MSKQQWKILSVAGTLLLAGLTVVFANSIPYAVLLIFSAFSLFMVTLTWATWEILPHVYTDEVNPKKVAQSIYTQAALNGGTIHATHIFPLNKNAEEDFSVKELSKAQNQVFFHRIMLLDSVEDERYWLSLLFDKLDYQIIKRFYTLASYPLLLPRFTKTVLPRLNLILFQSSQGSHQILVGLDRLNMVGVSVNFALHSRSKRIYEVLMCYYESITGSPCFRSCSSLADYDATQPMNTHLQRGQAVVSKIVEYAEITSGIMFVGLFGAMARAALGLTTEIMSDDTDADVDLLLLYDPRNSPSMEKQIRQDVNSLLGDKKTCIIWWGPDLSFFYPFRDEGLIDVDIECLPVGSNFYLENSLLGNSIFRFFLPLYSSGQLPITSYIELPLTPLTTHERWKIVVSDRQGFEYFAKRLSDTPSSVTDPRRLCSHTLRNLVWAMTGTWLPSGRLAGNYLVGLDECHGNNVLQEAIRLLGFSTKEIQNNRQLAFDTVTSLVNFALNYARQDTKYIGT